MTDNNTVGKVLSITGFQADEASSYLAPHVGYIYEEYGMEVVLTSLMWLAARGIMNGPDLTDPEKTALIKECVKCLQGSAREIKIYQHGAGEE